MSSTRAEDLLRAAYGARAEMVFSVVIPGEPRSKARPRFSRGHGGKVVVYSDQKQVAHEKVIRWHLMAACPKPIARSVLVSVVFHRSSRHRVDVDNMIKQILDSANRICWRDDYQVTGIVSDLTVDSESPRCEVAMAIDASGVRDSKKKTATCGTCGDDFEWTPFKSHSTAKYCSRECASRSRGEDLSALSTCLTCHVSFKRRTAKQTTCSDGCRLKRLQSSNVGRKGASRRKHPIALCDFCGMKVSRPEYRRCAGCLKASRKAVASV